MSAQRRTMIIVGMGHDRISSLLNRPAGSPFGPTRRVKPWARSINPHTGVDQRPRAAGRSQPGGAQQRSPMHLILEKFAAGTRGEKPGRSRFAPNQPVVSPVTRGRRARPDSRSVQHEPEARKNKQPPPRVMAGDHRGPTREGSMSVIETAMGSEARLAKAMTAAQPRAPHRSAWKRPPRSISTRAEQTPGPAAAAGDGQREKRKEKVGKADTRTDQGRLIRGPRQPRGAAHADWVCVSKNDWPGRCRGQEQAG